MDIYEIPNMSFSTLNNSQIIAVEIARNVIQFAVCSALYREQ